MTWVALLALACVGLAVLASLVTVLLVYLLTRPPGDKGRWGGARVSFISLPHAPGRRWPSDRTPLKPL